MKPVLHLLFRIIAAALACMLAGCGQKGPLYLPAKPVPVAVPAPASAPSPSDSK
ncbi:MAG TPA: lipoprotein [Noviherbaspirillum sp.]